MRRLKFILGIIFIAMAMGELATGFIAFPAVMEFADGKPEWWAENLPIVLLINGLLAPISFMWWGVNMITKGSLLTEKQSQNLDGKVSRWFEKRKYGYNKSDYNLMEGK